MLNRNPETFNEIVHLKRMLSLAQNYQVSNEVLDEISDFVLASPSNTVECNYNTIVLKSGGMVHKTFQAVKTSSSIDGIRLSMASLVIIPH